MKLFDLKIFKEKKNFNIILWIKNKYIKFFKYFWIKILLMKDKNKIKSKFSNFHFNIQLI